MKITFFNLDMKIGGVERQLYYLIRGLDRKKYRITLVLCSKEGAFLPEIPDDVKIIDLSIPYARRKKIFIAIRLWAVLAASRPDIFISFHGKLHSASVLACTFLRVKLVCCFPGYQKKNRLWLLRNIYLRGAKKLISVSQSTQNSLMRHLRIPDSPKNIVIENCIDIDEIQEKAKEQVNFLSAKKEKFIIVSAGRLNKEKNFHVLIKAAAFLPDDCLVLIIGDGDNRKDLEHLAKTCGATDKVIFLGHQLNIYKFIKNASVYVLSASDTEGLPTVLLEAMALGIPCICPDYNGRTKDVVADGKTGYIFWQNNPYELVDAINFFRDKNNSEKIQSIIRNAKDYALNHNIYNYAKQYELLLKR